MSSYLITGCSRGIGLSLTSLLAAFPTSAVGTIFATTRSDSNALTQLAEKHSGRVFIVKLDTNDKASIVKAAPEVEQKLNGKGLDVLINNAGIMDWIPDGVVAT
jgi:NAD(P)-dependent dehydrogenase (short-subunit alcohol dehydrogenase family)